MDQRLGMVTVVLRRLENWETSYVFDCDDRNYSSLLLNLNQTEFDVIFLKRFSLFNYYTTFKDDMKVGGSKDCCLIQKKSKKWSLRNNAVK